MANISKSFTHQHRETASILSRVRGRLRLNIHDLVCINSWGKYRIVSWAANCYVQQLVDNFACLSFGVGVGYIESVYQSVFTENSWLLQLEMEKVETGQTETNRKGAICKTKTIS